MVIAGDMMLRSYLKHIIINSNCMKRIMLVILILFLFHSCGDGLCREYIVENKTNKNLEFLYFKEDASKIRSKEVLANSSFIEAKLCSGDGGNILGYERDSIQVKSNEVLLKTYYPNDEGKSIFKTTDFLNGRRIISSWKMTKDKKNYIKYVFEITEEDLK